MARRRRKSGAGQTKKAAKKSKKQKEKIRVFEVFSDGERIPLKAKEVVSVEIIPFNRPRGFAVENYTFEQNEVKLAVPLPTRERIRIKYKA